MPKTDPAPKNRVAGKLTNEEHLERIRNTHTRCLQLHQAALDHGRERNRLIAAAARLPQWNNREVEYLLELGKIQTGVDLLACKQERNATTLPANIDSEERLRLVLAQHEAYADVLSALVETNKARKQAEIAAEIAVADRAAAITAARREGIRMDTIASELNVVVQRAEKMAKQGKRNRYTSETT